MELEPETSRPRSENHTPRQMSHMCMEMPSQLLLYLFIQENLFHHKQNITWAQLGLEPWTLHTQSQIHTPAPTSRIFFVLVPFSS